ncbi:DNA-binding protein [Enterococcus sp. AZ102]|uniref:DNA-binding protein n=1 Tax=unclassified Enterococcus TaxID=2608891 RepID=UPI003F278316
MNKTVKELADEIGVSKTAIYKKVNENQRKLWFSKIGNRFVISEEGQKVIKSKFETKNKKRKLQTDNQELITENLRTQTNNHQVYDLNEQLLKQIDSQALQIEDLKKTKTEQFKQIDHLHNLLDQQQQLQLNTQKLLEEKVQLLETKENEIQELKEKKWYQFWK